MGKCTVTVKVVVGVVVAFVSVTFLLILLSLHGLEYNEIGFVKRKSTGAVQIDKVYKMGMHMLGPDYTFKAFKSDAHFEDMKKVAIFTSDKLEVWITCSFQYMLRPEELPLLHEEYDIYYEDIVSNNALDALKVAATSYSTDEFISNRAVVEAALYKAVRERLGGVCCERGCVEDECAAGCKPQSECLDTDRGLFVFVKFFQMQEVVIPDDVAERYMRALVLQEETEKADFEQKAAVVERKTEAMVQEIKNQAAELAQNSTAKADLIRSWADTNATAIVERARTEGLRDLYSRLGFTDHNYKSSFDYLRTIKTMDNAHLNVEFDQLITGSFGKTT